MAILETPTSALRILRSVAVWNGEWETTVSGSAASALTNRAFSLASGVTASSAARARLKQEMGISRGIIGDKIDYDRKVIFHVRFMPTANTSTGISRFTVGKSGADGVADLSRKGFGFQIENLALKGLAHDGTDLTNTDLGTTLTANIVYDMRIEHLGDGTVVYYLDDVSKGTNTGGATGESGVDENFVQMELNNGADTANHGFAVWDILFEDVG